MLTPRAAAQVRKLLQENRSKYLRLSVSADYEYKLDLDVQMDPRDDQLGQSLGVPVVVDRKSAQLVPVGTVVDFVAGKGRGGFSVFSPETDPGPPDTSLSLVDARRGFRTTLARQQPAGKAVPVPPPGLFRLVRYDAPPGKLAAYLSPDPGDGRKHPAMIWIHGGDSAVLAEFCWMEGPPDNDQSASPYRKAGIVLMFPGLRGGNDNPGTREGFLGEVDDVLAAAEFLRKQPYVDPARIYLGGHSTGGTLALLVDECSDTFRAVFSFGPVADVATYGPRYNPFVLSDPKEVRLRSPVHWLHTIRVPTFVLEGTDGNLGSLRALARAAKNPQVHCFEVKGTDHFGLLAPTNRLVAEKILRDTGPMCNLAFTEEELSRPFRK